MTLKEVVPDYFPEGDFTLQEILQMKKTTNYVNPGSTFKDSEYLTLHKLVSFLHAALIMKGTLITYADIIR